MKTDRKKIDLKCLESDKVIFKKSIDEEMNDNNVDWKSGTLIFLQTVAHLDEETSKEFTKMTLN